MLEEVLKEVIDRPAERLLEALQKAEEVEIQKCLKSAILAVTKLSDLLSVNYDKRRYDINKAYHILKNMRWGGNDAWR